MKCEQRRMIKLLNYERMLGGNKLPRFLILIVLANACRSRPTQPALTAESARQLVSDSLSFESTLSLGECTADLPDSVSALGGKQICRRKRGIFIKIWSDFTEERGFLVTPLHNLTRIKKGTDPSYSEIYPSVYWYEIKG